MMGGPERVDAEEDSRARDRSGAVRSSGWRRAS